MDQNSDGESGVVRDDSSFGPEQSNTIRVTFYINRKDCGCAYLKRKIVDIVAFCYIHNIIYRSGVQG